MEFKINFNLEKNLLNVIHNQQQYNILFVQEQQLLHTFQQQQVQLSEQKLQLLSSIMIRNERVRQLQKLNQQGSNQHYDTIVYLNSLKYMNSDLKSFKNKLMTTQNKDKFLNLLKHYNSQYKANITFSDHGQEIIMEEGDNIEPMLQTEIFPPDHPIIYYKQQISNLNKQILILQSPKNEILSIFASKLENLQQELKLKNQNINELKNTIQAISAKKKLNIDQIIMDNEQYKTELLAQTQLINSLTEKIDGCDFQMKEAQQIQETLLQKEIVQNSSILEKLLKKQNADLSKQTSEEKLNQ